MAFINVKRNPNLSDYNKKLLMKCMKPNKNVF